MTSEFEGLKRNLSAEDQYLESENLTPDSFELLSAYIDGELSPSEKDRVQHWLDVDPEFKEIYTQLLALQGQMQQSNAPHSEKSAEEIAAGVFLAVDRHRRQRRKLIWGSSAIAASIIASLSGVFGGFSPLSPTMATVDSPDKISDRVMLAVAVDRPAINIPKSVSGYSQPNLNTDKN